MHLSHLTLNPKRRDVLRDLASSYDLHRTLLRAFPDRDAGGAGKVLFRVEHSTTDTSPVVLVQSEKQPDWSQLPAGYAAVKPVKSLKFTTDVDPLSEAVVIRNGDLFRFRLVANPTVKRNGKRHALRTPEEQTAWLHRKAELSGFGVPENGVAILSLGRRDSPRRERQDGGTTTMSHEGTRFEGVLRVTDASLMIQALEGGIGSAKGFGFGLLSLARG